MISRIGWRTSSIIKEQTGLPDAEVLKAAEDRKMTKNYENVNWGVPTIDG